MHQEEEEDWRGLKLWNGMRARTSLENKFFVWQLGIFARFMVEFLLSSATWPNWAPKAILLMPTQLFNITTDE